ncbi:MAG: CoA transferase [Hydrogenophilaceae bacterium]|jgi:crotonobetainyl-CoA:carnitine CoA-transferase CaiB-like acyl-CoA transferase|nr:CoA transferase [Hydrogenophilaceae bacterium]
MTTPPLPRALDGVRVLDLTRVLAGPWATQILGDLGAEVIKIEKPGAGDDTRAWGPPFLRSPDGGHGDAAYYLAANRNKRSVTVDFTTPEGAEIVRRLAARCQIAAENFKVGALKKYGLDYPSLSAINPALVYCSVTGFGQTGPYAPRAGYDFLIQGMGGLMSITGQPDDAPGGEPMKVGVAVADLFTGMYATVSILAALRHAERTGEGQHIDISLLDSQIAMLANQAMNYFVGGQSPARLGNAHPNIAPYQVFATADGFLILAIGNEAQFKAFAKAADCEAIPDDPRFLTNARRVANRAALTEALAPIMAARATADWIARLEAAGVPCGPINDIAQVFADPHVRARGAEQAMARPDGAAMRLVASPIRMSRTPPEPRLAPPALGADTDAVLREMLNATNADLAAWRAAGAI